MSDRYRVEFRVNSKNYFYKDCFESELLETKFLIKAIQKEEGKGKCFYRKFPVTKNKKIYF